MHRFLDLNLLSDGEIADLLALARELQQRPVSDALRGKVLGLVFFNPSLRTLASFQAGMSQLGGSSFVLTPGGSTWQLETEMGRVMDGEAAEHVREAFPVLAEYADVLGVRVFPKGIRLEEDLSEPMLSAIDQCTPCPLISLESSLNHPCQALGDWKTLDDLNIPAHGGKFVLSWAWHPKALPLAVPSAVLTMATRRGMDVTLLRPDGFELPAQVMQGARENAARTGGSLRESSFIEEAMDGAHVVYAKSWQSVRHYGDRENEKRLRDQYRHWCVGEEWYRNASAEAAFMHCLPVRRNVVVSEEILEGPRSRVVQQAGNRLHGQKAVLMTMLGGK